MEPRVIVLVADRDDEKHGEISVLEDRKKAERLVETLLEAGFEKERIRVFTGGELDIKITHKPIVALVSDLDSPSEEDTREESEGRALDTEEGTPSDAQAASGVRFSSLFPSA